MRSATWRPAVSCATEPGCGFALKSAPLSEPLRLGARWQTLSIVYGGKSTSSSSENCAGKGRRMRWARSPDEMWERMWAVRGGRACVWRRFGFAGGVSDDVEVRLKEKLMRAARRVGDLLDEL